MKENLSSFIHVPWLFFILLWESYRTLAIHHESTTRPCINNECIMEDFAEYVGIHTYRWGRELLWLYTDRKRVNWVIIKSLSTSIKLNYFIQVLTLAIAIYAQVNLLSWISSLRHSFFLSFTYICLHQFRGQSLAFSYLFFPWLVVAYQLNVYSVHTKTPCRIYV